MSTFNQPGFPVTRLRRLRKTAALREMFRETLLSPADFIYPLFIVEGENVKKEISSMPRSFSCRSTRLSRVRRVNPSERKFDHLFGIPNEKDEVGSGAYADDGIIQKATRAIKARFPEMIVVTDVCLCEYTSHGHCGVDRKRYVHNDKTLELIGERSRLARAKRSRYYCTERHDGRPHRRIRSLSTQMDSGYADHGVFGKVFVGRFTDLFARRRNRRLNLATARLIRWTLATLTKRFAKSRSTFRKAPTSMMVKPALSYLD